MAGFVGNWAPWEIGFMQYLIKGEDTLGNGYGYGFGYSYSYGDGYGYGEEDLCST